MIDLHLIYISGYGRSGTTALSGYLSRYSNNMSLGEIAYSFDNDVSREICSCGTQRADCVIWGDDTIINNAKMYIRAYGLFRVSSDFIDRLSALCRSVGKDTLIDSSKNAWKKCFIPFMLGDQDNVVVIHIQRNLIDVLSSVSKGRNRYLQKKITDPRPIFLSLLITFFGWVISNLIGYMASKYYDNVHLIKYENTFVATGVCVDGLQELIKIMGPVGELENRHEIAGNRTALT